MGFGIGHDRCCCPTGDYCMSRHWPRAETFFWDKWKGCQLRNTALNSFCKGPTTAAPWPSPAETFWHLTIDRDPNAWEPPPAGWPQSCRDQVSPLFPGYKSFWGGWVWAHKRLDWQAFPNPTTNKPVLADNLRLDRWYPAQDPMFRTMNLSSSCRFSDPLDFPKYEFNYNSPAVGHYYRGFNYYGLGVTRKPTGELYPGSWFDWLSYCVRYLGQPWPSTRPPTLTGPFTFRARSSVLVRRSAFHWDNIPNRGGNVRGVPYDSLVATYNATFGMRNGDPAIQDHAGLSAEAVGAVEDGIRVTSYDRPWPLSQTVKIECWHRPRYGSPGVDEPFTSYSPWVNIDQWLTTIYPANKYWWGFNVSPPDSAAPLTFNTWSLQPGVICRQVQTQHMFSLTGRINIEWTEIHTGIKGTISMGGGLGTL